MFLRVFVQSCKFLFNFSAQEIKLFRVLSIGNDVVFYVPAVCARLATLFRP